MWISPYIVFRSNLQPVSARRRSLVLALFFSWRFELKKIFQNYLVLPHLVQPHLVAWNNFRKSLFFDCFWLIWPKIATKWSSIMKNLVTRCFQLISKVTFFQLDHNLELCSVYPMPSQFLIFWIWILHHRQLEYLLMLHNLTFDSFFYSKIKWFLK